MQQTRDLAVVVLRGSHGASIDWAMWSTPRRGDSTFMQGLRPVLTCMQSLFRPRVGDGSCFNFWEVDWSGHKRFLVIYPQFHALALDPRATVWIAWDTGWFPSLPSTLLDQRYTDLLALHTALVPLQLSERAPNVWVRCSGRFSVRTVYCPIQDLESTSNSTDAPQMLPSPLEVPNSAKDQAVRMVAPTSKTDDAIPPTEVMPGRLGGVSFVRRSNQKLLPSLLRVSVCTDGMAGNTYEWFGHVHNRLILALHQRGAISTCVGMAIYIRHFVVNLASLEQSSLQRSSPFSQRNSAQLKGAHSFLALKWSRPLGFWTSVTDYLFLVIKSMTTGGTTQGASYAFFSTKKT